MITYKQSFIIQAAYGLAKDISVPVATNNSTFGVRYQSIRRNYLAPLENCISLVRRHLYPEGQEVRQWRFLEAYTTIASYAAQAYLSINLTKEAVQYFEESIKFDIIRLGKEGIEWPNSEVSLILLSGLARAYQKTSNLKKALETLNTALSLSQKIYGSFNETTVAITSRLKELSERQEITQRHHESVVVASTGPRPHCKATEGAQQSSGSQNTFLQPSSSSESLEYNAEPEGYEELDLEGESPANILLDAGHRDNEAMVKLPLGLPNINADVKDSNGRTPLWMASWKGHARVMKLLLQRDTVDVDVKTIEQITPLMAAAAEGQVEAVKLLLETYKVNVNTTDVEGLTPLAWTCWKDHEQTVQVVKPLLEYDADVNMQSGHYGTALQAASVPANEEVVKLLLNYGAGFDMRNGHYRTALQMASASASASGNKEVVKLLLRNGADVNSQGADYGTTLQAASASGNEEVVKLLLDESADVNAWGGRYGTALQAASASGNEQVVKLLVGHASTLASKYVNQWW